MSDRLASSETPIPIVYERAPQGVSRRSFRLLLFLTLFNTVLLTGYVLGPALFGFGREQWAQYENRLAEQRSRAAVVAARQTAISIEQRSLTYDAPPRILLYDDDPDRREAADAAMMAQRPKSTTKATTQGAAPWPAVVAQPDAYLALPRVVQGWGQLVDSKYTVLYMHERRASAVLPPRLLLVLINPASLLGPRDAIDHEDRRFIVLILRPTTATTPLASLGYFSYVWKPKVTRSSTTKGVSAAGKSLRLFAGETDPEDGARFVLPCEVGGVRGEIVGRLMPDDTVRLAPTDPLRAGWKEDGSSRTSP